MTSSKGRMCIAALALIAFVCHTAVGADSDDDRTATHAVTVGANGDDTTSIPDFDGDGSIGFGDFVIFAGVFGARQSDEKYEAKYDLNGDGEIGFSDFVIFPQNFGKEVPTPVVTIPDANLRAAIKAALGKASGASIYRNEMETLKRLSAQVADISDLTGLDSAANLRALDLQNNDITDISELASLTDLTTLLLTGNNITDISPLSGLNKLVRLSLWHNNITDISPLSDLNKLVRLSLADNDISDVSACSGLIYLIRLELSHNNITDVSPLSSLTNLGTLDLRGNPLNESSIKDHIPVLQSRGVPVFFDSFGKSDFDIELTFIDDFTERRKRELQWAARRWMSVISEDLPDYEFTQGWSSTCGDQSIEISSGDRIDDLRIYITSFQPQKYLKGWGSPHLLRDETRLPVVGCMAFTKGKLNLPITGRHEIGHVLGFGTVWDDLGLIRDLSRDDPNADTHFNGSLAIAAFDDAGGRDYTGAKVPVEMDGVHWRFTVLSGELMGPGGGAALSAITVRSLADLGYGVDVAQADAYTLPSAAADKTAAKVATSRPSVSVPGVDLTRALPDGLDGAELYGQAGIAGGFPSIVGDGRRTGRLDIAEQVWGRGVDFNLGEGRKLWSAGPPAYAEPELTCGAGLMNEPIYVVDTQGRVVRTIRH